MSAKPVLLEPVVNLEITIPSRVHGRHHRRHQQPARQDHRHGPGAPAASRYIKATGPMSEVMRYATELRCMTGGRGAFTMEFSHYDVVPQRIAETIIAQAKKEETEE